MFTLFYKQNGSGIFFRTSLVPSVTYILVINIGWAVFEKILFFDFSKFVHNFCKKFFFELILGVNLSCNGSRYGLLDKESTLQVTIYIEVGTIQLVLLTNIYIEVIICVVLVTIHMPIRTIFYSSNRHKDFFGNFFKILFWKLIYNLK